MNNLEKFIYNTSKNLHQCIIDLSLQNLFKNENITFFLPNKTTINNIIYNYIHNTEESIVQIKSLFIKGCIPKLEYFSRVNVVNYNNHILSFNKERSNMLNNDDDNYIILEQGYKIYNNNKYKKQVGCMVYNIETVKLPLIGTKIDKQSNKDETSNPKNIINFDNIKKKLLNYVKNNYYSFAKKDINVFRVFCNLIFNGLLKNNLNDDKVINNDSQIIINNTNSRTSYLSRSTFYLLTNINDKFNVFKHINTEIFELIENIIKNNIDNRVILKCDSASIYNNLITKIKQSSTNSFNKPSESTIDKLNNLSRDPTNIDFMSNLKSVYKKTYSSDSNIILNNHIFTILCEIYICMENNEINQSGVKYGYNEFKNNFLVFMETNNLNDLSKYSTDVVKMFSIFNTLTKCHFFLKDMNIMITSHEDNNNSSAYYRNPTNNNIIYITENSESNDNINYDKILQF